MASFCNLPFEISLLITRYLSESRLSTLKYLNSFFFNCWMDLKWKQVSVKITNYDSKRSIQLLQRVGDPFVAPRTKSLTINFVTSSSVFNPHDMDALPVLLRSLILLPNLTSLTITYPTSHEVATLFETIASSSLTRTLQTLKLRGHVEMLASLREYCAHKSPLENLTELDLVLQSRNHDEKSFLTLEPFLRSLSPTLRSLKIDVTVTVWFGLDISPVFDALSQPDSLVHFPNLKSLSLYLCINTSSPQSLRLFLLANKNLHHLHLGLSVLSTDEKLLGEWFADVIKDDLHFPFLQSLHIHQGASPNTESGLAALLALIQRTAPTLTSLTISVRGLTPENANKLVYTLAERGNQQLKSLSLVITCLSMSFISLLACKSPQLEKLSLWTFQIVGSHKYSFYDLLLQQCYNPANPSTKDVLHVWKLNDLKIYQKSDFDDDLDILDVNAVRAVAATVPALARCAQDLRNDNGYF